MVTITAGLVFVVSTALSVKIFIAFMLLLLFNFIKQKNFKYNFLREIRNVPTCSPCNLSYLGKGKNIRKIFYSPSKLFLSSMAKISFIKYCERRRKHYFFCSIVFRKKIQPPSTTYLNLFFHTFYSSLSWRCNICSIVSIKCR